MNENEFYNSFDDMIANTLDTEWSKHKDSIDNHLVSINKNLSINKFIDIYIDILIQEEIKYAPFLFRAISFSGGATLDAGYIYAPYVPILVDENATIISEDEEVNTYFSKYEKKINIDFFTKTTING